MISDNKNPAMSKPGRRGRQAKRIIAVIWLLLGIFGLTLVDSQFGGLRLGSRRANVFVGLAALWLPVVCVLLLGFLPRSRARLWALIGLVPVALLCLILGSLVGFAQSSASKTRQGSVRLGGSEIITYFSDAGAMDTGEVVVQQEVRLLPGLVWVNPLSRKECLRGVSIHVLDRHHVRCDYAADKADTLDPTPEAQRDEAWVF